MLEAYLLSPGEQPTAAMPAVTGTAEELAELLHMFATVGVTHLIVIAPSGIAGIERFASVIERLNQKS